MEELGLIKRVERRFTNTGSVTNLYGFEGLIAAAQPFAQEKIAEIEATTKAKRDRLARDRPKLVVDND